MTHDDWIAKAAQEIEDLGHPHEPWIGASVAAQIIEKHCPFQRDVAYVEVGVDADLAYAEGMEDAIAVISELPMYLSDSGDAPYQSGVNEGRCQAQAAIRAAIEADDAEDRQP